MNIPLFFIFILTICIFMSDMNFFYTLLFICHTKFDYNIALFNANTCKIASVIWLCTIWFICILNNDLQVCLS